MGQPESSIIEKIFKLRHYFIVCILLGLPVFISSVARNTYADTTNHFHIIVDPLRSAVDQGYKDETPYCSPINILLPGLLLLWRRNEDEVSIKLRYHFLKIRFAHSFQFYLHRLVWLCGKVLDT